MPVTNPLPSIAPAQPSLQPNKPKIYRAPKLQRRAVENPLPRINGVEGFASKADAEAFGLKLGALDTMRGAIQLIPGKIGEANMARDQKRLNAAIEKYGMSVVAAYGTGLVADPVGWAFPISKLRIPAKLVKAAMLAQRVKKGTKDAAQMAAYGGAVGALSYVDEDTMSLINPGESTSRMEQALIGAVAGPVMLGVGKGVAKAWNPKGVEGGSVGDKAWNYMSKPGPAGAAVGAGLGGFAGAKSGVDDTADTPEYLRDMFGEDFLNGGDWAKWRNGTIGAVLGSVGMRKVYKKYPGKILKDYNVPEGYVSAKNKARGEARVFYEGEILPVARKIGKLSDDDRQTLHRIITEGEEGTDVLTKLAQEATSVVAKLGRELVDAGLLDEAVWLANKDKYLHRLYTKHNATDTAAEMGGAGFIATELMSRGYKIEVPLVDWKTGKYDNQGFELWTPGIFDKGSPAEAWRAKRVKFLKDNDRELQDLYKREYKVREKNLGRKLTDDEKKDARYDVKDDFVTDDLRSRNAPEHTITIRRDWTKAEREEMGEITDAYDTFLATGKILAHDAATARMMRTIKDNFSHDNPNPAKGMTAKIPEDLTRYGVLRGQYVTPDLKADLMNFTGDAGLNKIMSGKIGRMYRGFNGWWKGTKTVGNPATHANNFTSNIIMYDLGVTHMGMKKWALLARAMRDVSIFGKSKRHQRIMEDESHPLNLAMRHGLLSANMVEGELKPVIREQAKLLAQEASALAGAKDVGGLVGFALNNTRKLWAKTGGVAIKGAGDLYSWEDNIFRYALWKAEWQKLVDSGIDIETAAGMAARKGREHFVDYENVPEVLGWLRELPLPFASYTYGIVPRLMESAMKHPMKIAKWAAVAAIANEAGWTMSDDSDREEVERLMEAQSIGNDTMYQIPGAPSTRVKIPDALNPFHEQGDHGFWNFERALPANVFDQREGGVGQIKILPGFGQPGFGALGAIGFSAFNVDQFKGQEIPEGEVLDAIFKQFVPNIPGVPGSYAQTKIDRASSGRNATADEHIPFTAWASAFGLKLEPQNIRKLTGRVTQRFKAEQKKIKKQYYQNESAYANGNYDEEKYESKKRTIEKRMKQFVTRMNRSLYGD